MNLFAVKVLFMGCFAMQLGNTWYSDAVGIAYRPPRARIAAKKKAHTQTVTFAECAREC